MGKKITLELDADVVVQITENHGGYEAGKCLACGTHGWLCESRYGFPYGSKRVWRTRYITNHIVR